MSDEALTPFERLTLHLECGLDEPDLDDLHDAMLTDRARIEELETAIKRQAGASKTLRQSTLAEVQHLKDKDRSEYVAAKTVASEREANAILTDRIEELEAEAGILRTEKHADAECIGSLESKLATAVDALREIASGPEHNTDAKIARATIEKLKGGDA